ncbi:MAG TPA: hypothetical protein VFH55_07060 [Nitrospiria bacterium]|nr:hypothetical protein [Nitrospiria bacterium]
MKRRILIPAVALLILFGPKMAWADSQVYVSFSVGGAVVIGAGVIYWGVSSGSRVSRYTPSEEDPNRLRTIQFLPQLFPQFDPPNVLLGERPRADFASLPNDSRTVSVVELPLFVFRW